MIGYWILWTICGLVAAGYMLQEEYNTHNGISISDLIIGVVLFIAGPVVLVLYLVASTWDWLEENGLKVIIKKKKYDI